MAYKYCDNPVIKLKTINIIEYLQEKGGVFTASDIAGVFNLSMSDACHRIRKLQLWGLISRCDRLQKRSREYQLTDYGKKFNRIEEANEDKEKKK